MKHWSREAFKVDKDRLPSEDRGLAAIRMSRTTTIVWKLRKVRKKFTTIDEMRFWTYITDFLVL